MGKRLMVPILVAVLGFSSLASAGLVGHWKLDDGSGTTAWDSGGNGYHGTLVGDPTWVTGVDGGALQFDGRDDYVNMSNFAGWPAGGSPRSMTGWGKTDTVAAGYRWIVAYGSAGTNQAMFIGLNGTTLYCGGYGNDVTAGNTWVVGEWFHIGLTYDGTTARAYVNGREVGSAAKAWNLILGRAHIGRQVNDAAEFWDGTVDDVRIYDHALTAAEMKALVPPKVKARQPNPADGAVGVLMPLLQWTPGETALFEDVYLGTTPELTTADRVATRQPAVLKMYFHLQPLVPGQTYYWRVDAIEPAGTVHTGGVWSFTVTPKTAWAPKPADGTQYVDVGVALQWTAGMNATAHDVYFGTDRAAVEAGTGGTFKGNQPTAAYTPTALERGTTYYWRVDEVAGPSTTTGPVWSFTVRPILPKTDPTLVGWYKLEDENAGTAVVDYSGWDYYGTLIGQPRWVEGYYGEALDFDGDDDHVDLGNPRDWPSARAPRSLCGWAKTDTVAAGWKWIAAYGSPANTQAMFIGLNGTDLYGGGYGDDVSKTAFWEVGVWHHICLTYDGTTAKLYADGLEVASAAKTWNLIPLRAHIGRQVNTLVEFWDGMIDDVRVYNVALTPEGIKDIMRGEPSLAWNPQPRHNANADIRETTALSWSAGQKAAQHDVYFGTDKDAVKAADTGSPLYRGRQSGTSFALAALVEFGGGSYFWRVDEVEADGTIHKGMVWSFTIPGYLIVEDMEGYTDEEGGRIYEAWIDGWTNGTGSQAGYLTAPFAERTIVHDGKQSLPVDFNNARSPFYSEIERTFAPLQDWTVQGVTDLSLWFRGHPVSFVETAPGSITMSASGNDIWNNADQFRFAFKRLTGNGSITVKVESVGNTNGWAKAGVMIRESLDPGSRHAAVVVTPSNGVSFPRRVLDNDVSTQINQTGVTAPHWVRLTRTGDVFKAEHSADGKTWASVGPDATASSASIPMLGTVHIGLCLTSHNTAAVTTAQFPGVAITGGVSGQWQSAGIGADHPGNSRDDLYLAVEDSAGKMVILTHPDPAAVLTTTWTEWKIPLSSLTGVNLARVKKMYLGIGDRQSPAANGTGRIYLDDFRVTKP
jgi:regulation of enolase protein 1 (concanavalin A-like superfamily)